MTANECYRPPIDAQVRYTVQWFHEWSEMQRCDFLPILAQKLAPGNYVNGLLSGVEALSCNEGRPPSLFQCRVKLFREWFETWSQAERDQLLTHIKSMDPAFHTKIQEELQALSSKPTNGLEEDPGTPEEEPQAAEDPAEEPEPVEVEATENGATDDVVNGDEDDPSST